MQLHPKYAWTDEAAMRRFAEEVAFAHIVTVADARPIGAHAPLVTGVDGSFLFHLARANPLTSRLDGAPVLASIVGTNFYVSPDWYGTPNQVPTWNYRMVEIEGIARRVADDELRVLLDRLSAVQEARLAPKPPWTSAKMDPARRDALIRGIIGFAIDTSMLRGTIKLGQDKSGAEAAGVIAALRAGGDASAADEMTATR